MILRQNKQGIKSILAIENEYWLLYDDVYNSTISKTYPKYSRAYTGTSAAPVTVGIAVEMEPL
jgi:hypothetical protein